MGRPRITEAIKHLRYSEIGIHTGNLNGAAHDRCCRGLTVKVFYPPAERNIKFQFSAVFFWLPRSSLFYFHFETWMKRKEKKTSINFLLLRDSRKKRKTNFLSETFSIEWKLWKVGWNEKRWRSKNKKWRKFHFSFSNFFSISGGDFAGWC